MRSVRFPWWVVMLVWSGASALAQGQDLGGMRPSTPEPPPQSPAQSPTDEGGAGNQASVEPSTQSRVPADAVEGDSTLGPLIPWLVGAGALLIAIGSVVLLRRRWLDRSYRRSLDQARAWASSYLQTNPDSADADEVAAESLEGILTGNQAERFLVQPSDQQQAYLRASVRNQAWKRLQRRETRSEKEAYAGSPANPDDPVEASVRAEFWESLSEFERALLQCLESGQSIRAIARELDSTPYRIVHDLERLQQRVSD